MKKNKLLIVSVLFLLLCCKNNDKQNIENYSFFNRIYNFQNKYVNKYKIKVKVISDRTNKKFIYSDNETKNSDTLKFINGNVYMSKILLKKIDTKEIKISNSIIKVDKYFYQDLKKDFRMDKYYYLNRDLGFILSEYLFSGSFVEYNINRYNSLHKQILNGAILSNKLGYKKGSFELEFPKYVKYPELNMMDSIKDGKYWRYFIKN